ncbi:Eco57I restriction-modification methylase domain-containing protein [Rubrivirga sp. IMCC43871]|uniref:Eco57I restriction-modification methylase domain-containing protein n=1 Tax=Rubrivirga sp. IMCC43871 TaxID=3391575 RepID=UPI00398FDDD1
MPLSKQEAKARLADLVATYDAGRDAYTAASYKETPLRTDFLDPFLDLLGWTVGITGGQLVELREVVQEETIEIEGIEGATSKNPDYTLRIGGRRQLFVEAKKPSVRVESDRKPAYQIREYGWNAGLTISALSNFEHLAVYDCTHKPTPDDDALVARFKLFHYAEYVDRFDEIYDLLSRDRIAEGAAAEALAEAGMGGGEPFDAYFLRQIERWRLALARSLVTQNPTVDPEDVNVLIQQLLDRIIFLRICEDRRFERYEQLREIETMEELEALFAAADAKYNSGLFDLANSFEQLGLTMDAAPILGVFQELYFPASPYNFAVVDARVLGEIYEQFLGNEVVVTGRSRVELKLEDGGVTASDAEADVELREKPEVAASSGVVTTPPPLADAVVARTLDPLLAGRGPADLAELRICDPACGSGSFLLSAYEHLLDHYLRWYAERPADGANRTYTDATGALRLTVAERQRILTTHLYGVDKDPQAVEAAKFSLLLKVLEGQPPEAVDAHVNGSRALPDLRANVRHGNSLVDGRFYEYDPSAASNAELLARVAPFDWAGGFPEVEVAGGFDAIVGNPPYIRIQNMVQYAPEEVEYFRSDVSPFTTADRSNFDEYYLFIERSLDLLRDGGRLGFIVPHKFMTIAAGKALRKRLTEGAHLRDIAHFGTHQLFTGRLTYTAIVVMGKEAADRFAFQRVDDPETFLRGGEGATASYAAADFGKEPWGFVNPRAAALFDRVRSATGRRLDEIADITAGIQTSADSIYVLDPITTSDGIVTFEKRCSTTRENVTWQVESEVTVPWIQKVQVPLFGTPLPNALLLFPYHFENGNAEEYLEDELQARFPLAWDYLLAHRDRLERRSIRGGNPDVWYRFGRDQHLNTFDGRPKLVWRTLSRGAPYGYDELNVRHGAGGNGPYYSLFLKPGVDVSLFYLLGLLAHPLLEAMVLSRTSEFHGDYYSHGKQFVRYLPVAEADEATHGRIADLTQQLVEATARLAGVLTPMKREQVETQRNALRQTLNREVSTLYGLSDDDLAAVHPDRLFLL